MRHTQALKASGDQYCRAVKVAPSACRSIVKSHLITDSMRPLQCSSSLFLQNHFGKYYYGSSSARHPSTHRTGLLQSL